MLTLKPQGWTICVLQVEVLAFLPVLHWCKGPQGGGDQDTQKTVEKVVDSL